MTLVLLQRILVLLRLAIDSLPSLRSWVLCGRHLCGEQGNEDRRCANCLLCHGVWGVGHGTGLLSSIGFVPVLIITRQFAPAIPHSRHCCRSRNCRRTLPKEKPPTPHSFLSLTEQTEFRQIVQLVCKPTRCMVTSPSPTSISAIQRWT